MKRTFVNPVIKDKATFVKYAAETENRFTELEISLMPGGSNPLHFHKTYSETFTALDGNLGVKLGKESKILKPGESFTVPPRMAHSFFNPGAEEIRFKVVLQPGHSGFENSIKILYGLAGDGLTNNKSVPKNFKHTALVAEMSDMYLPGLINLLSPLVKRVAKKAKAAGEEKKLLEKYCSE